MSKVGRNEPCPCGSGRKLKLCHGAVAIAAATSAPLVPLVPLVPADAAAASRTCGPCTACCEGWAEGEIRGHRMHAGQHCHFLLEGACTLYDERPHSPGVSVRKRTSCASKDAIDPLHATKPGQFSGVNSSLVALLRPARNPTQ